MIARRSLLAGLALSAAAAARAATPLAGLWTGTLLDGETKLRLRLKIDEAGKAELESLDQAPDFFFPGQLAVTGDQVEIAFPTIGGQFKGRLMDDGVLDGVWRQVGELPLRLSRAVEIETRQPCRGPRC